MRLTRIHVKYMFSICLWSGVMMDVHASESLFDGVRHANRWESYIVVSTGMPQPLVVSLAKQATISQSTMVLNGFSSDGMNDVSATQAWIADVNQQCCHGRSPKWTLDPILITKYKITAAPSFVIAKERAGSESEYGTVSGDIDMPNALKLMSQRARSPLVREAAKSLYMTAYGGF